VRKAKFIILLLTILLLLAFLIMVVYETPTSNSFETYPQFPYVSNTIFAEGGNSNDTIKLTVLNALSDSTLSIQKCTVNNESLEFAGDMTIPSRSKGDITITLASGALIGGKRYDLYINPNATNGIFTIHTNQRYLYYHMYHPNATSPVEEAIITELYSSYYSRYSSHDEMGATIQNTGDFPITITGGFVNGMASISTTGQLTINKNETGEAVMLFQPRFLLDQMLCGKPFHVRLVTTSNNLIDYVDPYYFPDCNIVSNSEKITVAIEKGEITDVELSDNGLNSNLVSLNFRNTGNAQITIESCLVNGKAVEILQNNTTVDVSASQKFVLKAGFSLSGSNDQIVLISSENSAFIYRSMP
jgi:hypothetical protein